MFYIVDSHPIIWYLSGNSKLSAIAAAVLRDPASRLIVPTIALAEIQHLYARRRVPVSLGQALMLIESMANGVIYPFNRLVLDRMPVGLEIHDAIIIATALVHQGDGSEPVRLVTSDQRIIDSGLVDVLW